MGVERRGQREEQQSPAARGGARGTGSNARSAWRGSTLCRGRHQRAAQRGWTSREAPALCVGLVPS